MLQFYLSMMNSGEDKALVEFLYNEYKQLMFKTAYAILRNRESAEDAVHDAFLRVINIYRNSAAIHARKTCLTLLL